MNNKELIERWERAINTAIGNVFKSDETIILAVNFLEAQFKYNKSLLYCPQHQNYILPIIRRIFPKIVDIHESYLNKLDNLIFDPLSIAIPCTVVKSIIDPTPIFMDIERMMIETVEYDIEPIVLRAIKDGTLQLGPLAHVKGEYDGDTRHTLTTYLNIISN